MDLSFHSDEDELRQAVHVALARTCPVDAIRAFFEATPEQRTPMAAARWNALSNLGVPALLAPPSAGGLGLSDVDLVGVIEEAGWWALPEPLLETAALAAPLLTALVPAPSATDALHELVTSHAALAVGGIEIGASGPTSPTTVSTDGMLHTPRVVGGRDARVLLLACQDPESGWQLHAVPAEACAIYAMPSLDHGRDLSRVDWPLSSETLLAYGVAAEVSVTLMADRGATHCAAFLLGLADRMITLAVDFANAGRQLHQSIDNLGTVKRLLAHARVMLESARPAVYRAAWSLATAQPTVSHDASVAKALASDAADLASQASLEVFGARGYTWECDLHFFVKRSWALCRAWGDAAVHRQLVLAHARTAIPPR